MVILHIKHEVIARKSLTLSETITDVSKIRDKMEGTTQLPTGKIKRL